MSKPVMCVCARYVHQALPSGARVDLICDTCGHRIATDWKTTSLSERGLADLVCIECAAESGITLHYPGAN